MTGDGRKPHCRCSGICQWAIFSSVIRRFRFRFSRSPISPQDSQLREAHLLVVASRAWKLFIQEVAYRTVATLIYERRLRLRARCLLNLSWKLKTKFCYLHQYPSSERFSPVPPCDKVGEVYYIRIEQSSGVFPRYIRIVQSSDDGLLPLSQELRFCFRFWRWSSNE
jgi:hypothetical protein